jgi:hypothetical protein
VSGPDFSAFDNTNGKTDAAKLARKPWLTHLSNLNGPLTAARAKLAKVFQSIAGIDKETVSLRRSKTGLFTARVTQISKVRADKFSPISV